MTTSWRFWWGLIRDAFGRRRVIWGDRTRLEALRKVRQRKFKERLLSYEVSWCHTEALRMDRARTIRLEVERQQREYREGRILHYSQPWGSR